MLKLYDKINKTALLCVCFYLSLFSYVFLHCNGIAPVLTMQADLANNVDKTSCQAIAQLHWNVIGMHLFLCMYAYILAGMYFC